MTIFLNFKEWNTLHRTKRADRSKGGFQSFMVKMQDRADYNTGALELNSHDVDTIRRYYNYDNGGYESRLRKIFSRHLPFIFGQ